MKSYCLLLLVVSVLAFTGCKSTSSQPTASIQETGVAFRALHIESSEWNRTKATVALRKLLTKIKNDTSPSYDDRNPLTLLPVIHRSVRSAGYSIDSKKVRTFGDALGARTLDCSDLTLLYLEVLDQLKITAYPMFARNHVFIVLPTETGPLFYETTLGQTVTLESILERDNIATESVELKAYMVPEPATKILSGVYLEMGLKMGRTRSQTEKAEEFFRKAIEIHPQLVSGYTSLAAHLCRQEKFSEAEPLLKEAMRLDPTSPELCDFASALYESIGDTARAIEMCEKAFVLGTENEETLNRFFRISVAEMLDVFSRQ